MAGKDYYSILKVAHGSNLASIKKAYRKLALQYHPDRVPEPEKMAAEAKFKEITEAYYVLSNKGLREQYDREKNFAASARPDYEEYVSKQWAYYAKASTLFDPTSVSILGWVMVCGFAWGFLRPYISFRFGTDLSWIPLVFPGIVFLIILYVFIAMIISMVKDLIDRLMKK